MQDRTSFIYKLATGQEIVLQKGLNGITHELIETLYDLERIESNEARRDREHICQLTEFMKGAVHDDGNPHIDPIDNMPDLRWSPETIIFSEVSTSSLMDKIEAILPYLTQAQQELFRLLRLGMSESQIAKAFGISNDSVKSRRRYLYAAIRRNLGFSQA